MHYVSKMYYLKARHPENAGYKENLVEQAHLSNKENNKLRHRF